MHHGKDIPLIKMRIDRDSPIGRMTPSRVCIGRMIRGKGGSVETGGSRLCGKNGAKQVVKTNLGRDVEVTDKAPVDGSSSIPVQCLNLRRGENVSSRVLY